MKSIAGRTLYITIYLLLLLITVTTCKKIEKSMLVSTGEVSNLAQTSADVSGTIVDLGEGASQYGHCYGTSPNVTVSGTKTSLGFPPGTAGI